jgi:hypothetical protein
MAHKDHVSVRKKHLKILIYIYIYIYIQFMFNVLSLYCGKHTTLLYFKVKDSSKSFIALNTGACAKKRLGAIIIPCPPP